MPQVNLGNFELYTEDRGAGTPLLFVHGFPLNHTMWQHQIEAFAASYRVIAPDLRGFGKSSAVRGDVTMKQYADDMNALLDKLSITEPVVFCGLSMGGYVGWQFWKHYSERVRALILCDTRADHDSEEAAMNRLEAAQAVREEGPIVFVDGMLQKLFAEVTHDQQPEVIAATRDVIMGTDRAGISAALHGMAARSNANHLLAGINVPTLLLAGEFDQITPPDEMRQIAAAITGATFEMIPNAGHMTPLENADAVTRAMRNFLAALNTSA